jgi:hypothetical protein
MASPTQPIQTQDPQQEAPGAAPAADPQAQASQAAPAPDSQDDLNAPKEPTSGEPVSIQKAYSLLNEKIAELFHDSGIKEAARVPYLEGTTAEHVAALDTKPEHGQAASQPICFFQPAKSNSQRFQFRHHKSFHPARSVTLLSSSPSLSSRDYSATNSNK